MVSGEAPWTERYVVQKRWRALPVGAEVLGPVIQLTALLERCKRLRRAATYRQLKRGRLVRALGPEEVLLLRLLESGQESGLL
jgi:hypothetical protein